MLMRVIKALIVAAFIVFISIKVAQAQALDWQIPATACLPTDETIQQDLYQATANFVRFKSGKSGRIILRCGVTPGNIRTLIQLQLTWAGTDGQGIEGQGNVRAELKRINATTGNWGVVGGLVLDSDSFPSQSSSVLNGRSVQSPHTVNFATHYYYVEISIRRSPGSDFDPRVYGVKLR